MDNFVELSDEQRRETVNTRQLWNAWQAAVKRRSGYAGSMVWRSRVRGGDYLYRLFDEPGKVTRTEKSLGVRSLETERIHAEFHAGREETRQDLEAIKNRLQRQSRLNKALDLGRVPTVTSRILRHLHRQNLLGGAVVVAGTNSIYGYESATGIQVGSDMLATGDLDILFDARARLKLTLTGEEPGRIIDALQVADKSFRKLDAQHRAVNRDGFFVELIKPEPNPPWRNERESLGDDDMKAAMIANMRWIANAPKFHAVAIGSDGLPVPICCADPRAFALYKLNMGTNDPTRDPVKRHRDVRQAELIANIVHRFLPQYPFDMDQLRFFPKAIVEQADEITDPYFR